MHLLGVIPNLTAGFLADKVQPSGGDQRGLRITAKMTGVSSGATSPGFQMPTPRYGWDLKEITQFS